MALNIITNSKTMIPPKKKNNASPSLANLNPKILLSSKTKHDDW
jgi:hypothetical protein